MRVPLPTADEIEAMIDAAFWASLRREEGYTPKISLAYLRPDDTASALIFEMPLPLAPDALTRLAPAVERPGIHLGVSQGPDGLSVWGTTFALPPSCFVLEVVIPGLVVLKHSRAETSGKFVNLAVLEGDRVKVLTEAALQLPDCPGVLNSLFGLDPPSLDDSRNVLVQLAVSMRAHGRGGSLLVVPAGSEAWRESIVPPIRYSVSPPFAALAHLLRDGPPQARQRWWEQQLRRAVDAVAGLTAVDGATVISNDYELLAFGAKIGRRDGAPRVEQVILTEPVEGSTPEIVHPAQLGGTRHLSAAQFEYDQPDAVALVASQDGRFTIFAWSPCDDMVYAHRVEALLL